MRGACDRVGYLAGRSYHIEPLSAITAVHGLFAMEERMIEAALVEYNPTIKEMPTDERPRERLEQYGPAALSLSELLAIILRTGTKDENVVRLATRLLVTYHGLAGLAQAPFSELVTVKGLGRVKATELQGRLRAGPAADGRRAGRAPAGQVARRRRQPPAYRDGHARAGASAHDPSRQQEPRAQDPHGLHRLAQHRRGARRRAVSARRSASTARPSSSPTTTPPATRRPRPKTSTSRGRSWRPASCWTSTCWTTW